MDTDRILKSTLYDVAFLERGKRGKPQVFFIHGAPGSAADWAEVMGSDALRDSFHCAAIDRPGYGDTAASATVGDVQAQVQALQRFLKTWADADVPLCIVGHSYGVPVAASLACSLSRGPFVPAGLVLVSGVLDPSRKHSRWYHSLLGLSVLRWILKNERRRGALEMKRVSSALRQLGAFWPIVDLPVHLIHGTSDWIVDYENSRYAYDAISNPSVELHRIEGAGHDLPKSRPELVARSIAAVFESKREGAVAV